MPADALAAVLVGALLHATWNAVVKSGRDKTLDMVTVSMGGALIGLAIIPFVPLPESASLPYLAASVSVHFAYYVLVAAAYRAGDMSLTYPIMRGGGPLIVAATSGLVLGETLSGFALWGVLAICAGVLSMALGARHGSRAAVLYALANAVVIAVYTYADGLGARAAGSAVSYAAWLFVLSPLPFLAYVLWTRPAEMGRHVLTRPFALVLGGACTVGSYVLALWAMTRAPIAVVAALRETSILFAAVIGWLVLKEALTPGRVLASCAIAAGVVLLRAAG